MTNHPDRDPDHQPEPFIVASDLLIELPTDAPADRVVFEHDGRRYGFVPGRAVRVSIDGGAAGAAAFIPLDYDAPWRAVTGDALDPSQRRAAERIIVTPDADIAQLSRATVHAHSQDNAEALAIAQTQADTGQTVDLTAAIAAGRQIADDVRLIRDRIGPDQLGDFPQELETEFGASLIEVVADWLPGAFATAVDITVTHDPEDSPADIASAEAEMRALSTEVHRIIRERRQDLAAAAADAEFWHAIAVDTLAHAWAWAVQDGRYTHRAELAALTDDEFSAAIEQVYNDGPYLQRAIAVFSDMWGQDLADRAAARLTQPADTGDPNSAGLADWLLDHARANLQQRTELAQAPTPRPAFDSDGHGETPSDFISHGARYAMVAAWPGLKTNYPEFLFAIDSGTAIYTPSQQHYPTPAAAWQMTDGLSDDHADLFDWILASWLANRSNLGPFGGVYLTPAGFLADRGLQKHSGGGYRREQKVDVAMWLHDLASIHVRSQMNSPVKGRRGSRETFTISAPLLVISHEITQAELLSTEQTPVAWYVRPGDWSAPLANMPPQYALTMQSILRLHSHRDRHAKRIGRYLTWQYRVRAAQRTWGQPYHLGRLLDQSGVEVDRKNPGRFKERLEAALNVLVEADPPVIKSWRYVTPVTASGRGWLDRWLATGLIITPPAALTEKYEAIGAPRRRRTAKVLPPKT